MRFSLSMRNAKLAPMRYEKVAYLVMSDGVVRMLTVIEGKLRKNAPCFLLLLPLFIPTSACSEAYSSCFSATHEPLSTDTRT